MGGVVLTLGVGVLSCEAPGALVEPTIARVWNEQLLDAIRNDTARPTIHARTLYHLSAAMYDAWAAYDDTAAQVLHHERASSATTAAARAEAISYAAYRMLSYRFVDGPGGTGPGRGHSGFELDQQMNRLGYDVGFTSTVGDSPAALGNRIAQTVIVYGLGDGANEANNYADPSGYQPVNDPMAFDIPGTNMVDPNRWQPLRFLRERRDQFGTRIEEIDQEFLSPYWGDVKPFALTPADRGASGVYHDAGAPPQLNGVGDAEFRKSVNLLIRYSSLLDPNQSEMIDISPASRGNAALGSYEQQGHLTNPYTGQPYAPQMIRHSDWGRIIAEFWADGPDSEAPPGHWNVIGNDVSDKMDELEIPKRIGGRGPVVDNLEWDVKMYLALDDAVHDAGVAAWNHKGYYDYSRPVSMIRYMGQRGQSTDPNLMVQVNGQMVSTYDPDGLALEPGLVEVITPQTTASGERHEHLAGHEGEIAIHAWQGPPGEPHDTPDDIGGVGWILAEQWLPYQRDDFVTPPFAAYLSGHSAFSRAGAEVMTALTGDEFFPGGMFEYFFPEGTGLEFEYGPTQDFSLQWATYYDAADEAGLSRLYGGIHVPADDLPGRVLGSEVGKEAWNTAMRYYNGTIPEPASAMVLGMGAMGLLMRSRRMH